MAIEVLLMSDVPDVGQAGTVTKVADGFARNYLLPKGLAAPVTPASMRKLEKLRKEREELARLQLAEARSKAGRVQALSITIRAKTTDGHKLYGSVGAADIVTAVSAQGVELDRAQVQLEAPLHETGQFEVPVRLHADVTVPLKVWVVEE